MDQWSVDGHYQQGITNDIYSIFFLSLGWFNLAMAVMPGFRCDFLFLSQINRNVKVFRKVSG